MRPPIDRYAVVCRNNPTLEQLDPYGPFSVGNGEFCFTADVTGLQSFYDYYYENGIPLETKANWAWHSFPNPKNYTIEDALEPWDTAHGRRVRHASAQHHRDVASYLRANPHHFPLGKLAFQLIRKDGSSVAPRDLRAIHQELDLWSGLLDSRYEIEGIPVHVQTVCHPALDTVAVRVESELVSSARLQVVLHFPYVHDTQGEEYKNRPRIIWDQPDRHTTCLLRKTSAQADFLRVLDTTTYYTSLGWSLGVELEQDSEHRYILKGRGAGHRFLELTCRFSPNPIIGDLTAEVLTSFDQTVAASHRQWDCFWRRGAMLDFADCTDPRAAELERRTILSLYLTRLQCAGSMPPEETGLTYNSWHGKHNIEMVRMHLGHFALWGRIDLLENGLDWFLTILDPARERARRQGFGGARWPKMTAFNGLDSPGRQVVMIWQQPHPIYLAELSYRTHPDRETVEKYQALVFETAQFMADFAAWDEQGRRYVLGPPLWQAQEVYGQLEQCRNPTFELTYWAWGLETAQLWRERLSMPRHQQWDHVIQNLSSLPTRDGLYVSLESDPRTWESRDYQRDMPTLLKACEWYSSPMLDIETMHRTLLEVVNVWDFESKIWGSDYSSIAMTAARVGEPEIAMEMLTRFDLPGNRFLVNGHCNTRDDLRVYLPANSTLLAAVGLLAGGWDGGPNIPAPGFPKNGQWNVRVEGFKRLP